MIARTWLSALLLGKGYASRVISPHHFLALYNGPLYSVGMAGAPDEMHELPPPTPAPPELVGRATALVRSHSECFWFWHAEARVRHLEDVRLVIEHLREYGDRRAWWAAQDLHRCLSPLFKRK